MIPLSIAPASLALKGLTTQMQNVLTRRVDACDTPTRSVSEGSLIASNSRTFSRRVSGLASREAGGRDLRQRGRTSEAKKTFRVVYTAVETRAPRFWKSQVGWNSGRSAATNRGAGRPIGALPNTGPLSPVRTQRQVKVFPVGIRSPAGTKVSSPAVVGIFFSIGGEGSPAGRDTRDTFATRDGTSSQTRTCPNLMPVAEMT
jgi:hypothetical protein